MRAFMCCLPIMLATSLGIAAPSPGARLSGVDSDLFRVYEVNKRVSDFPDAEDLSTPEAAYASINRVMANGEEGAWRRISVRRLANRLPPADADRREVRLDVARMWLRALIVEVRLFRGTRGAVIARITRPSGEVVYDLRGVELEDGRWLNRGQDIVSTIDDARSRFATFCAQHLEKPARRRIEDPKAYLKPFVEFLQTHGEDPKGFVMDALARHKLVILGEVHHRPRYWSFHASLVEDPAFARTVGVIYMELPANGQPLVDEFLAAKRLDTGPVVDVLRDMLWMGWPDKPMLDFFVTVWQINQFLPDEQRLRIVLTDMQRPWKDIRKREDWRKYEAPSRDRQMADNVLGDLREHASDERHALFIVGVGHAMLGFEYFDGSPVTSAGHYLRKGLTRDDVYSFFPHTCVMTNSGRVDGRLCLGLFGSAFAACANRPTAFPLNSGPFGEQPFDAFPDRPVASDYRDGYDAYLYLGPLEDEILSPLIPGFYSDEFVAELDRRHRLMFSKGLVESYGLEQLDGESFMRWMGQDWGQPRRAWKYELGPVDAWHKGGTSHP